MLVPIATRAPFSFDQTLVFARRFAPVATTSIIDATSLTAALASGGRAWAFTLRETEGRLVAEVDAGAPSSLASRIGDLVGASDELTRFYAAAQGDPAMRPVIRSLHGLHQLRFLGLEDIAVHCVLMQRTPMPMAVRWKRAFVERFGHRVEIRGHTLYAVPELAELARLDPAAIAAAIRHPAKGERIATVVRGVAALGETFLRTAPFAEARDALLAIPGVGPFSAGAILLRGLGRTDELPSLAMFANDGRAIYGARWNEAAIRNRYGADLGTWAFYLKTAAARAKQLSDPETPSCSAPTSRSGVAAARTDPRRSPGSSRDRRSSPRSSRRS